MTVKLSEALKKEISDLTEAEIAEIKSSIEDLSDEHKEKFASILESEEAETEDNIVAVKAVYDAKEKVAVASTDILDRHGERINQEGWDLKNFKKNPVMLWGHDHNEIAVGNARNIHIERASGTPRLVFTPDFHEKTEKARALKALFEEGWLNSFSVGFIPKEFDGKENTYLKQELLEISAVNVPANAEATMLAFKHLVDKGFKKSVAKEVTAVEETEEPTDNEVEAPVEVKSLSEKVKGALADEIASQQEQELKWKKMEALHDIWWAFIDLYYDEETPVEDFDKLLGELIVELKKVNGDTNQDPETDPMEDPVEDSVDTDDKDSKVLDSTSDADKDDNNIGKCEDEPEDLAKTQENEETSAAPEVLSTKETRAKQSLSKVISRASDILLTENKGKIDEESTKLLKVVKRASEILNASNKK